MHHNIVVMLLAAGHHSRHSDLFRRLQSLLGGEPQLLRGRFLKAAVVGKQRLVNDDLCWRRTEKEGERERESERMNNRGTQFCTVRAHPYQMMDGAAHSRGTGGLLPQPPSKAKRESKPQAKQRERERERVRERETESLGERE